MPLKPKSLFAKQGSGSSKDRALAEFWRIIALIAVLAVVMVAAALVYLGLTGDLDANLVIATTIGVFFSMLLGCGLFAAAFFSDKSGHDQAINDSTKRERRD